MQFIKHSPGFGKKPHLSTIKISDNEFFYTSKQNPQVLHYYTHHPPLTHPPSHTVKRPPLNTTSAPFPDYLYDPQKRQSDLYNKFSMYAIRFIRAGPDSDDVAKLKRVNPEFCFEVVNEERGIIFELPSDEKLAIMSDEEAAYVAKEKVRACVRRVIDPIDTSTTHPRNYYTSSNYTLS